MHAEPCLHACRCKALWRYEGSPSYFCAAPDGDARLWCFIENDNNCKPTAEPTDWSWDYCSPNLAPKDCVGQVTGSAADTLTHASSIRIMAMALFVVLVIMQVLQ